MCGDHRREFELVDGGGDSELSTIRARKSGDCDGPISTHRIPTHADDGIMALALDPMSWPSWNGPGSSSGNIADIASCHLAHSGAVPGFGGR